MTTLTIRRKALAKQEEVPQIPLTKYRRGWRRLLAEHFVARLLCRLATIVFQYEQPERRREITVLAVRIEVTDKLRQRHVAITRDLLQRIPELILENLCLSCGPLGQSNA